MENIPHWFELSDRKYTEVLLEVMEENLFVWKSAEDWRLSIIGKTGKIPGIVIIKTILRELAGKTFRFHKKARKVEMKTKKVGSLTYKYYRMVPANYTGKEKFLVLRVEGEEVVTEPLTEGIARKVVAKLIKEANVYDTRKVSLEIHSSQGVIIVLKTTLARIALKSKSRHSRKQLFNSLLESVLKGRRVILPKQKHLVVEVR